MNSPVVYLCALAMLLAMLMLFFDKGYKKANRFLAGFLFFSSLYILTLYVTSFSHSTYWSALFLPSVPSCFFLIGPFSYLYVRSIVFDNIRFHSYHYLHFVLFVVCFTGSLPFLFSSWQHKLEVVDYMQHTSWNLSKFRLNIFLSAGVNQGIRPLHLLFYLAAQWRLIYRHFYYYTSPQVARTSQWHIIKKWLLLYSCMFTFISIGLTVAMILFFANRNSVGFQAIVYGIYLVSSAGYAVIVGALLLFPQVLYGLSVEVFAKPPVAVIAEQEEKGLPSRTLNKTFDETIETTIEQPMAENTNMPNQKQVYAKEYIQEIENRLKGYIKDKKHLDPECSLSSLSNAVGISSHHLSYYFNTIALTNFPDWRNNHRIEHAIVLIETENMEMLTLSTVAQMSGFVTQKTFIKAFKLKMGSTPVEFIKSRQAKSTLSEMA